MAAMNSPTPSPLHRQVARVWRRLFYQTLVNYLVWWWAGALVLSAGWFLIQPLVLPGLADSGRWGVAGGLLGLASLLGAIQVNRKAPSPLAAALALDKQFGLKERVTTCLTLSPEQAATPAGEALLSDVNRRLGPLDVGYRFPVRLSWSAALVPAGATFLALVAIFYVPASGSAGEREDSTRGPQNLADIGKDPKKPQPRNKKPKQPGRENQPKPDEEQDLDAEVTRLIEQPPDPEDQDQVVEHLQDMNDKEEKLKDRLKDLADKAEIKEEINRLQKKLAQSKDLTKKERDQIADQLQDLRDRLQRLSRQDAKKEHLKRDKEQGKIDQDKLERELKKLDGQAKDRKDLAEMVKNMEKLQQALKDLDKAGTDKEKKAACARCEKAAEQLQKAAEKAKNLKGQKQEMAQVQERLRELEAAQEEIAQNLNGNRDRKGQRGGADRGQGRRPDGKEGPIGQVNQKARARPDSAGKKRVSLTTGRSFKKVSVTDVVGEVREAAQAAPEALERQRIPVDYIDIARGYFENLAGQKNPADKGPTAKGRK
jgi:hypothetical protein